MRREAAGLSLHGGAVLEAAFEHLYNAMVITDADFGGGPFIRRCNPAFCAMTGYTEEELIGQSPRILQGPDTDRKIIDQLKRKIRAGEFFEGSTTNYRKGGVAYVVQWNISPVRDADGVIVAYVSIQQDITARFAAERERSLLAEALNAATDPVIVMDKDFDIVFANNAFGREVGRPVEDLLGRSAFELKPRTPEGLAELQIRRVLAEGNPYRGVVSFELSTGTRLHVDLSISSLVGYHDSNGHYVAIAPNITHMVEQQMALQEMAYIDALTGLLNRRSGQVALEIELQQAAGSGAPMSVTMGDDALPLAERVRNLVETTPQVASDPVTMSFGVGQWRPGESVSAFVERIDAAMYAAKSGGRNRVVCSP